MTRHGNGCDTFWGWLFRPKRRKHVFALDPTGNRVAANAGHDRRLGDAAGIDTRNQSGAHCNLFIISLCAATITNSAGGQDNVTNRMRDRHYVQRSSGLSDRLIRVTTGSQARSSSCGYIRSKQWMALNSAAREIASAVVDHTIPFHRDSKERAGHSLVIEAGSSNSHVASQVSRRRLAA